MNGWNTNSNNYNSNPGSSSSEPEVLNQGSTYSPQGQAASPTSDEQGDVEAEEEEEVLGGNISKKMLLLIGGGILLVAVIIGSIVSAKKGRGEETELPPEEFVGTMVLEDGTEVACKYDENGDPYPIDADGNPLETNTFEYDAAQVAELRRYGYTGDEIEEFESNQMDYNFAIENAQLEMDNLLKDRYLELREEAITNGSDTYKKLVGDTWLQGVPREVSYGPDAGCMLNEKTLNVDYVKLPARGDQLWLKLTLPDGTINFMLIDPIRYSSLASKGNIVVNISEYVMDDGATFVYNIQEYTIASHE